MDLFVYRFRTKKERNEAIICAFVILGILALVLALFAGCFFILDAL